MKPCKTYYMTQLFRHSRIEDTKRFKMIKKIRNYLPLVNLSLKYWFSEVAVHIYFSKYVVFNNLAKLQFLSNKAAGRHLQNTYRLLFYFCGIRYLFSAEYGIYCWQPHPFLFWTPLKTRVKPQKQLLELFYKKSKHVLRNFANFAGKQLCCSLISDL